MTKTYPNPPIVEVILKVRLTPSQPLTEESLLAIREAFVNDGHPVTEVHVKGHLTIDGETERQKGTKRTFVVRSEDRTHTCSFEERSFSYSFTGKYTTWTVFLQEARRRFGLFSKEISEFSIQGLVLRYVNRIKVPFDEGSIDFTHYFRYFPDIPQTRYTSELLDGLFCRQYLPCAEAGTGVVLTHVMDPKPQSGETVPILLDIEVRMLGTSNGLWERLEQAHDIKNALFEECTTEKAKSLFEQNDGSGNRTLDL